VEIRWIENLEVGGSWEAFRIAGEDLGLDITHKTQKIKIDWIDLEEFEARTMKPLRHEQARHQPASEASAIQVRSPAPQRGSDQIIALQLAESLNIQETSHESYNDHGTSSRNYQPTYRAYGNADEPRRCRAILSRTASEVD
jgi:hypothetical protein